MPRPMRIRSVLAASDVRNTSDAEQCEYSSRKWCSTAQAWSMPSLSARTTCSVASWTMRYSASSSQGLGSWSSYIIPNFMRGSLPLDRGWWAAAGAPRHWRWSVPGVHDGEDLFGEEPHRGLGVLDGDTAVAEGGRVLEGADQLAAGFEVGQDLLGRAPGGGLHEHLQETPPP